MADQIVWRLKKGSDRRVRAGHPWVYSNELAESPKGLEPGAPVELRDAEGKFLARGYGNPHSLIAFRVVSREPSDEHPMEVASIATALARAERLRVRAGLGPYSHRLCFGEADGLPGLVIDRYRIGNGRQVFVVQTHTAGMDRLVPNLETLIETFLKKTGAAAEWERSAIILRNDLGVRKLEGLQEEEPKLVRALPGLPGVDYHDVQIEVRPIAGEKPVLFSVDLIEGQKTGFFLDQAANVALAAQRLAFLAERKSIRIIDLCCYVGQWGAQLARFFREKGVAVEVLAVDASATALARAKKNIEAEGARCETLKGDVLKDLAGLEDRSFDLVISDPPALIKSRKDIPAGTHAYLQLNTQVFRLLKQGGGVVSCSCSALLEEEEMARVLTKSIARNRRHIGWVAKGSQAPDHPMRTEFPEGRYLKCWIGIDTD